MLGQTELFVPEPTAKLRDRVTVALITTAQARHTLETFHYLHRTRSGPQLNYAVTIDGIVDGVITYAYPMMSAPLLGVPSDELLEFARLYLHQNLPHSASCAIGKTIRRVQAEWQRKHPEAKPPRLVVSWSDSTRHLGTVYKAANFTWIKRSSHRGVGRYRGPGKYRTKYADFKNEKDCWVFWFDPKARRG